MDTASAPLEHGKYVERGLFSGNSEVPFDENASENVATTIFRYDSLQEPTRQVRLLTILPVVFDEEDELECILQTVELKQNGHSCLSYRCGTDEATHTIRINGFSFPVKPSLYQFLQKARQCKLGPLWIDALSINQSDLAEKSAQVRIMGDIYSLASQTVLWLGIPDTISDELLSLKECLVDNCRKVKATQMPDVESCVKDVLAALQKANSGYSYSNSRWIWNKSAEEELELLRQYSSSIEYLVSKRDAVEAVRFNPYWSRAWIVQEILLSSNPVFLASSKSLRLQDFLNLHDLLHAVEGAGRTVIRRNKRAKDKDGAATAADSFYDWVDVSCKGIESDVPGRVQLTEFDLQAILHQIRHPKLPLSINDALNITVKRGCANPVDRIYAIRALLAPHDRFAVDYEMDDESLFYQVVSTCVLSSQDGKAARNCAELLFPVLSLRLSRSKTLPTIKDLLRDDLTPSTTSQEIFWAEPYDSAWYTGPWRLPHGLYLPIKLTDSQYVILEILVKRPRDRGQADYANEFAKASPYLGYDLPDRSWILKDDEWKLCSHELFAFQRDSSPETVGLFGDPGRLNVPFDPVQGIKPSWREEDEHEQSVDIATTKQDLADVSPIQPVRSASLQGALAAWNRYLK